MRSRARLPVVLWLLGGLSLLAAVALTAGYFSEVRELESQARNAAQQETRRIAAEIDASLRRAMPLAEGLAATIGKGGLDDGGLRNEIERVMVENSTLFGVGVAFEPFAFDPGLRLYAPYLAKRDGQPRWLAVDDFYDYTDPYYAWYSASVKQAAHWNEPYFGEASGTYLLEYVAPIRKEPGNESAIGLVYVNYAREFLQQQIDSLQLGRTGYAVVVSREGRLIAYPDREEVANGATIFQIAEKHGRRPLNEAARAALAGRGGMVRYRSEITGGDAWLHYAPIPAAGWAVLTVFNRQDAVENSDRLYDDVIHILLAWSAAFVLLMTAYLFGRARRSMRTYVIASTAATVVFACGILGVWYLALQGSEFREAWQTAPVTNHAYLRELANAHTKAALRKHRAVPVSVPTGVFVHSMEFSSANNVIVTGYVWQRYEDEYHKDLSRGVVFPEAESIEMEESYRRKEGGAETIGWEFKVTLRQSFDYSKFPFDRQSVWIRLWHKDFDRHVVLVPDLGSYDRTTPEWLPGVEKDLVLPGWMLTRSYFDYRYNGYNTNFGIDRYGGQHSFPELYFNVDMKRNFIDPFISRIAPVVVVLLMLFAILVTISKDAERRDLLGFNAAGIVASCSALFFVVLVAHIDLRSSLSATEIIYLEHFYFVSYLALLLVTVNSILFTWGTPLKFVHYRDNLIPKLLFWPGVSAVLFIPTVITFYR